MLGYVKKKKTNRTPTPPIVFRMGLSCFPDNDTKIIADGKLRYGKCHFKRAPSSEFIRDFFHAFSFPPLIKFSMLVILCQAIAQNFISLFCASPICRISIALPFGVKYYILKTIVI